jgi:hypothetical protein
MSLSFSCPKLGERPNEYSVPSSKLEFLSASLFGEIKGKPRWLSVIVPSLARIAWFVILLAVELC